MLQSLREAFGSWGQQPDVRTDTSDLHIIAGPVTPWNSSRLCDDPQPVLFRLRVHHGARCVEGLPDHRNVDHDGGQPVCERGYSQALCV